MVWFWIVNQSKWSPDQMPDKTSYEYLLTYIVHTLHITTYLKKIVIQTQVKFLALVCTIVVSLWQAQVVPRLLIMYPWPVTGDRDRTVDGLLQMNECIIWYMRITIYNYNAMC